MDDSIKEDQGQKNMASVKDALSAASEACRQAGLAGKPEALHCAIEHCSSIMRMTLGAEIKGSKQTDPSSVLIGVHANLSVRSCSCDTMLRTGPATHTRDA
jgi:hypothetical protein